MTDMDFFADDAPAKEGFTVDSLEAAEWCLTKIGRAETEITRFETMAASLKARIDARLEEITKRHRDTCEHMTTLIRPWAELEIAKQGKVKSMKLLSGTVGFRQAPSSLVVTNETDAVMWLENETLTDCVRVKKEVVKSAVKKVIEEKGIIPDGCELKAGEVRFYVEPLPPLLEGR